MNLESRFTKPRPDCPNPEHWTSADADATEYEVLDLMWGVTRATQPDVVLETGTHRAHMTIQLTAAVKRNGHGHVYSYEPNAVKQTSNLQAFHETDPVTLITAESMGPWTHGQIDLAWFDSLLHLREAEFNFYLPYMHARTIVGFHDAGPHHGAWSDALRNHPRLQAFDMPTPRGMLLGRVVL